MTPFEYGFFATRGQRSYQEDAALVWPPQIEIANAPEATFAWDGDALPTTSAGELVAVLADGMGGHAGGALAARSVCQSFIEHWVSGGRSTSKPQSVVDGGEDAGEKHDGGGRLKGRGNKDRDGCEDADQDRGEVAVRAKDDDNCKAGGKAGGNDVGHDNGGARDIRDRLISALKAGNDSISDIVSAKPALSGMGSTLVGTVFVDRGLEWISVGDSPLYLYRREQIALLNEDHSLAPALDKLAEEGKITREQAKTDPRRHMLRSAITGEDLDLVDFSRKPLQLWPGDYVIVASDGIHTLDTSEMVRLIKGYQADGPLAVCQALVRAIENARDPYQDNATVIAVRPID